METSFIGQTDAWYPPANASMFTHRGINFCNEMCTHNYIYDYKASVTGTAGTSGHSLSIIAQCNFDTYWQADPGVAEDDQYFELELSDAIYCDSYIINSHKPQEYRASPYTPYPNCWKAWTLEGKLLSGDAWTTLETVATNTLKFYRGTFTRGEYKYFRIKSISAYDNIAQDNRIDAYLYTMGIYDSTNKWHSTFPDTRRGDNDINDNAEYTAFTNHWIYIQRVDFVISDVYDINGETDTLIAGLNIRRYRQIGDIWLEFYKDISHINYPQSSKFLRLNSIDFVANSGICLYALPPPNEIWWMLRSGYAFDETSSNLNTPILINIPDNSHKISPSLTTIRKYSHYSELGARFKDTRSGMFKVNKYYITFNDPLSTEFQEKYDGQEGEGLITDMNGTALTGAANANSNRDILRLKIGDIWKGHQAGIVFDPPIKLDGDNLTHTFETQKSDKSKGSVLQYTLRGFKVPKS